MVEALLLALTVVLISSSLVAYRLWQLLRERVRGERLLNQIRFIEAKEAEINHQGFIEASRSYKSAPPP